MTHTVMDQYQMIKAKIIQLVEVLPCKQKVEGSSPSFGSIKIEDAA